MVRKFVSGWLEISDEDPAAGGTAPTAADGTPTVDTGADTGTTPGGTPPLDTAPTGDVPPVDVPAEPVPVEAQPDGQPPINPEAPAVPDQPSADPAADPASTDTAGPDFPGTDLHRNDHQHTPSDDVRTWQAAATDNGIDVGKVDGFFGPRTEDGVRQAQTGAGVDATGVIDAGTWPLAWA